jgi:hypothetical protein
MWRLNATLLDRRTAVGSNPPGEGIEPQGGTPLARRVFSDGCSDRRLVLSWPPAARRRCGRRLQPPSGDLELLYESSLHRRRCSSLGLAPWAHHAVLGLTRRGCAIKAIRAKKRLLRKSKGRDADPAARPFYHPCTAFRNPVYFLLSHALVICGGSKTIERSVLPQTLRRPAPNFLAAASFWQGIASRYFWLCHAASLLSHANFF